MIPRMVSVAVAVGLMAGLMCAACPASAQAIRFEAPHRDCNLAEQRDDGFTAPRWVHHAIRTTASAVLSEGIHRTTKLSRGWSAVASAVAVGLVSHVVQGAILKQYPINLADWGYDLFNASTPLIVWMGASGHNWQSTTLAVTTEVAGRLAGECYASP